MKTKRVIQSVTMVAVLAALTVLGMSRPVEADDRLYPHIHYSGSITQPDGNSPIPWTSPLWPFATTGWDRLAPQGCFGSVPFTSPMPPNRYQVVIAVIERSDCVQAMQTFQPDLSAFPLPEKSGWTFTRK